MNSSRKENLTKYGIFLGVLLVAFLILLLNVSQKQSDDLSVSLESGITGCTPKLTSCSSYNLLRTTYVESGCPAVTETCPNGCISTGGTSTSSRCINTCSNGNLYNSVPLGGALSPASKIYLGNTRYAIYNPDPSSLINSINSPSGIGASSSPIGSGKNSFIFNLL